MRHPARAAGASLLRMQSDERLIELALAGHEAAFDAIVVRYRSALTRYCAGIVGPSRADDAVQQTLINAHDALHRTDDVRHLRSWLYRIAHNVSLNVLRGVRDDVSLDATASASLAADGPAAEFERSEQFRATVAALQALPERQRAALVLRELEGRSHEEIADALGVTKGSARQHLMRARVAMRGAVTAVTPYPLIVRLADLASASGGGAGWGEAVAGAGLGATLTKLTAGVVATGARVGGAAVGTDRVVHGGHDGPAARAAESVVAKAADAGAAAPAAAATVPSAVKAPVSLASTTTTTTERASSPAAKQGEDKARRHRRKRPRHTPAVTPRAPVTTSHHGKRHKADDDKDDNRSKGSGAGNHDDSSSGGDPGGKDRSGPGKDDKKSEGGDTQKSGGGDALEVGTSGAGGKGSSGEGDDAAAVGTTTPPPTATTPTGTSGSGSSGSGSGSSEDGGASRSTGSATNGSDDES